MWFFRMFGFSCLLVLATAALLDAALYAVALLNGNSGVYVTRAGWLIWSTAVWIVCAFVSWHFFYPRVRGLP